MHEYKESKTNLSLDNHLYEKHKVPTRTLQTWSNKQLIEYHKDYHGYKEIEKPVTTPYIQLIDERRVTAMIPDIDELRKTPEGRKFIEAFGLDPDKKKKDSPSPKSKKPKKSKPKRVTADPSQPNEVEDMIWLSIHCYQRAADPPGNVHRAARMVRDEHGPSTLVFAHDHQYGAACSGKCKVKYEPEEVSE